jgi:hypothetical protein
MSNEELDRILAAGLADYTAAEPRNGLEQRVLAHVRAADRPSMGGWWRWAVAVPVVAALLITAVVFRPKPHARATVATVQPPAVPERTPVRHVPPAVRPRRLVRRVTAQQPALSRRDQFPVPSPLSPEEKALVDLVRRFPEQAREAASAGPPRSLEIKPIEIPEITIPPVTGGSR